MQCSSPVTLVADRSPAGRETGADAYARRTLTERPGFEGSVDAAEARRRQPLLLGAGARARQAAASRVQGITVAAFHRPTRATDAVVAFRQREAPIATVERMLATVRGG